MQVYTNLTVDGLLTRFESMTNLEKSKICAKVVEEKLIRRIDRLTHNKENPAILNTLFHLKIVDNSALLLEVSYH